MMEHSIIDLEAIAAQVDTDKRQRDNGYLPLYIEYFRQADSEVERDAPLRILEIGTNKGASLRLWAEYFPNAEVYGLDITRKYEIPDLLDHARIHTFLVDQGDREALLKFAREQVTDSAVDGFDIIIDDGSHEQTHQQVSLGVLFPFLKPGGLYVIEDLITGRDWMNGLTWNRRQIKPTRILIQEMEQLGQLQSSAMKESEMAYIHDSYLYCEYRESPAIIYTRWHPEIGFIVKEI